MYIPTKPIKQQFAQARAEQQQRHTEIVEMTARTLTLSEASERYGESIQTIWNAMHDTESWHVVPGKCHRYMIENIEEAVAALHATRAHRKPMTDLSRPLWFVDDTASHGDSTR